MTIMRDTLLDSAGRPVPAGERVKIITLGPRSRDAVYVVGAGTMVDAFYAHTDASGAYTVDLPPTDSLLPAGARYQALYNKRGVDYDPTFTVPNLPGTHEIQTWLTPAPGAIGPAWFDAFKNDVDSKLAAEAAARLAHAARTDNPHASIRRPVQGNLAIGLGDSVMVGGSTQPGLAADYYPGFASWFAWACYRSQSRLIYQHNAGVGGNTSAQGLARMQADVIAKSPSVVFIQFGANDANASVPVATYAANIEAMVALALRNGILPVLCTPHQWSNSQVTLLAYYAEWVRAYATRKGLPLMDLYAALVDPATGLTPASYTGDNYHLSIAGAKLAGSYVADRIASWLPIGTSALPQTNIDPANLVTNGLFINSAAGLGTGWFSVGGAASIVAPAGNVRGNRQRFDLAGAGTGGAFQTILAAGNLSPGDVVQFSGRMAYSAQPAGNVWGALRMDVANVPTYYVYVFYPHTDAGATDGIEFCLEQIVPANVNRVVPIFQIAGAASGPSWLELSQIAVRNKTTRGLPLFI